MKNNHDIWVCDVASVQGWILQWNLPDSLSFCYNRVERYTCLIVLHLSHISRLIWIGLFWIFQFFEPCTEHSIETLLDCREKAKYTDTKLANKNYCIFSEFIGLYSKLPPQSSLPLFFAHTFTSEYCRTQTHPCEHAQIHTRIRTLAIILHAWLLKFLIWLNYNSMQRQTT